MDSAKERLAAGLAALERGDLTNAVQTFLSVSRESPLDKRAVLKAATALRGRGRPNEAIAVLRSALTAAPGSAALLNGLADAYADAGLGPQAKEILERLVDFHRGLVAERPDSADFWVGLGKTLSKLERWDEAEAAYRRAVAANAEDVEAALCLGTLLMAAGRTGEARALLEQVLALDPGNDAARALHTSGADAAESVTLLLRQAWSADSMNAHAEARQHYEDVLKRSPGHVFALSRLLTLDGIEGRLADARARHEALITNLEQADLAVVHWMHLAVIAYQAVLRPIPHALLASVAAAIDRQLAVPPPPRAPRREGRIRVGYLSSMLRDHPIGHVTAGLFAAHDRSRFEVHVFYLPEGAETSFTRAIAGGVEHFITLSDTSEAMIAAINDRDIDILVYLDGYMALPLLPVVAARPARAQVFWLGHAGGCDLSAIDDLIADATVVPPGEESLYRAEVIRLPDTYHCASPHPIGAPMTRAEAGLPEEGFVFCAFNNPEKIETVIFESWMRILARVDGSVLWLSRTLSPAVEENLRAAAESQGINRERLVFAARLPDKARHLARHFLCGLFLDTLTLNASTTALDALWTGLPLLTVAGTRFGGRIAASFLRASGLENMIVPDLGAYEERAVYLATHPDALSALHSQLAKNLESRPLFKINAFCRALEANLETIYKSHEIRAGDGPQL